MDGGFDSRIDPETGDLIYNRKAAPAGPSKDRLAERMDESTRARLSDMLTENISFDEDGQSSQTTRRAGFFELLGIGEDPEPDDDEEAADNSNHPLMLTALLRFQAKALSTLLPSDDVAVRTKPAQDLDQIKDPDQRAAAQEEFDEAGDRVADFYTEYLFERLPAYEEDTDAILYDMGLLGLGIRKIGLDRSNPLTPVTVDQVPLEDLIISYNTKNLRRGRITHRIDMPTTELARRLSSGQYRPVRLSQDYGLDKSDVTGARDAAYGLGDLQDTETHRIYESHCELVLKDDPHPRGFARPYIVTIHANSNEILAIERNWRSNDASETPIEHFVAYPYHPGKNASAGVGLGDILGGITRSLRKAQRRSFEAAYLQNHPSGFKLSSMSVRDEGTRVRRGEFIDIDSPTQDIRAALMPHVFAGPSQGLLALSEALEQSGKELGGIASIDFAALMKSGVAAGPAMAAFEESTEFQTAVHRRLYKAHRKELKLIHDRMREVYGNEPVVYGDGRRALRPGDLIKTEVIPYMKPGEVSRQRMILEAQATYELSGEAPDIIDRRVAVEEYLRAMGRSNIDDILLPPPGEAPPPEPADPITEYTAALAEQPIAAGPEQNHAAHIVAHAAQMRLVQNSDLPVEQGEAVMAALSAHIAEHMGLQLLMQVSASLGVPPDQLQGLPPAAEMQLAQAIQRFEEEARPPEAEDTRIATARIKAETDREKSLVSQQEARAKEAHDRAMKEAEHRHELDMQRVKDDAARELQRVKDEAAMDREVEDNTAAVRIAKMKGGANNAGARAGTKP